MVTPSGTITTIAGNGLLCCDSGDEGQGGTNENAKRRGETAKSRDNQPATVAHVVRDGLLDSASKEEALMNRDLRQQAASARLSMLLDQLETALPVLAGVPSLRPAALSGACWSIGRTS